MTEEQLNRFEATELEGVLPSIDFIIQHLAQYGDQFDVATGHLARAARSILRVGSA